MIELKKASHTSQQLVLHISDYVVRNSKLRKWRCLKNCFDFMAIDALEPLKETVEDSWIYVPVARNMERQGRNVF